MNSTTSLPKQLRVLRVAFDTHLAPWEIPAFRAAVASKVGLEHEWFHNHRNELLPEAGNRGEQVFRTGYHYRYPLIQYKTRQYQMQQQPLLICLDDCVEEAHKFFSQSDWNLDINGDTRELRIAKLDVQQYNLRVWEKEFHYNLFNWMALNTDNYEPWMAIDSLAERLRFLERKLISHILAFGKGINWWLDQPLEVTITQLKREKQVQYKSIRARCFDISFKANVFLPEYIGLGKGSAKGFGVVRRSRTGNSNK